jgi:hypothetical protein
VVLRVWFYGDAQLILLRVRGVKEEKNCVWNRCIRETGNDLWIDLSGANSSGPALPALSNLHERGLCSRPHKNYEHIGADHECEL